MAENGACGDRGVVGRLPTPLSAVDVCDSALVVRTFLLAGRTSVWVLMVTCAALSGIAAGIVCMLALTVRMVRGGAEGVVCTSMFTMAGLRGGAFGSVCTPLSTMRPLPGGRRAVLARTGAVSGTKGERLRR